MSKRGEERSRRAGWLRMAAVVVAVVALDQAVKALVVGSIERGEAVEVLPFLDLVYVLNDGVAFGFLGGGSRALVLAVTGIALACVLGWFAWDPTRPGAWLAIGLLAGGALGNLIDRIGRDAVVDFIDFPAWPSFNLADIAITAGAATLALVAFAPQQPEPDRPSPDETEARGAG